MERLPPLLISQLYSIIIQLISTSLVFRWLFWGKLEVNGAINLISWQVLLFVAVTGPTSILEFVVVAYSSFFFVCVCVCVEKHGIHSSKGLCQKRSSFITIAFLCRGVYPSEVLPHEVQGRAARRDKSFELLLENIKSALCGVRCGYMRILSICRCISRTLKVIV